MSNTQYRTVKEVFEAVRTIREALESRGYAQEAARLSEVVDGFWTTSSEALIEVADALSEVRTAYEKAIEGMPITQYDEIMKSVQGLLDLK